MKIESLATPWLLIPGTLALWLISALFLATPVRGQHQDGQPIELSGFSVSEAFDIVDDEPLDLSDPLLQRLMYRIAKTSPMSRCEYRTFTYGVSWKEIVNETGDLRCRIFEKTGTIHKVIARKIPGADSDSTIQVAYVCACTNSAGNPFVLLTLDIPRLWQPRFENRKLNLDEPVKLEGFLFGRVMSPFQNDLSVPLFVTQSVGWFPQQKNFEGIGDSHLSLAKAGLNIGLLDLARTANTKPLNRKDAEAFYQMLSIVDKATINPGASISFQEMMENASRSFGEQTTIQGVVRQCTEIQTSDADLQTRLDLFRYYQLIVFPDLDGKNIVIRNRDGREDVNQRLPITVVCKSLPKGLQPQDLERKSCRIQGFVYRFWRFQSERTDQSGFAGQISPLVMTNSPVVIEKVNQELDGLLYAFIITVLSAIIGVAIYYRYMDRKHRSPGAKILDDLPDQINTNFGDESREHP